MKHAHYSLPTAVKMHGQSFYSRLSSLCADEHVRAYESLWLSLDTSSGCFGGVLATFRYSTELIILGISSVITLMESASIEALSFIVQLRPVSAHPKATSFGGDESSPCHLVKEPANQFRLATSVLLMA
ncbi:TPA: hypothetical protein NDY72_000310 [Enterobacter cloacae]|uniref:hypothetical protein n=1 Tax=Enterobacter cloacae TaxID=550 RepID=UPI00211B942A|nr:hypothetical protein [Enterobacter cloacae]MCQ9484379.1 hypothetical protein [Enterobacter cloacae]MCQ9527453.1 hypothetical protein [Enterobacter cloacae]MCQ9570072.1 hypothetical protein [Enterobacter cloacae]HCD7173177.1 hypothetical protein [Enterobacter cloacae]HDC4657843.1 hypothetical protein [Enterobacter cloacae]